MIRPRFFQCRSMTLRFCYLLQLTNGELQTLLFKHIPDAVFIDTHMSKYTIHSPSRIDKQSLPSLQLCFDESSRQVGEYRLNDSFITARL